MLFELGGGDGTKLNEHLHPAYKAWVDRNPAQAYKELRAQREVLRQERESGRLSADDWIFSTDVLSACAMYEGARVVGRAGALDHPDDPNLVLSHIWETALHGKLFDCQDLLASARNTLPEKHFPVLKALEAYNFSVSGWRKSGTKAHLEADADSRNDALAQYILSRGASYRSAWSESIETGTRALELAPGWVRARSTLSDALLAQGRAEEALELLEETPEDAIPFYSFGLSKAIALEAMHQPEAAINCLSQLLDDWPLRSRYQRFAARQLALLQLIEGRDTEAEQTIERYSIRSFPIHRKSEGTKRFISLPLVSQAHNHCVPTVAAMVSEAQGQSADPLQFANDMNTTHGTPMWRMVDYMKEKGFQAFCVKPELECVQYFIDRNIPLIGVLNGLFSSHVDVINGYDTTLGIVHIRDPMHWYGRNIEAESLQARYRDSEGLWAVVQNQEEPVPGQFLEPVGEAFVALTRATAKGRREDAEKAFAGVPDDHPLVFARDSIARFVVLDENEYDKRLDSYVDWDQPLDQGQLKLEHLHAILAQISHANADRVIKLIDESEERFGERFAEYIRCQCLVAKLEWQEAHQRLTKLSRHIPQVESMWRLFSVVEEQLGNAEKAEKYLAHALDIAPEDASLNRQWLDLHADSMTCQEQYELIARLAEENPDNIEARWTKTHALMNLGDGLAFEASIKESIRFWPRYQLGYETLADWYL
ncbi:MAG: C39 family peptidase, partial [Planctomycetota bacterium]